MEGGEFHMAIKRVPVCFNLENRSQSELFKRCEVEFGKNMSGGIRSILWSYFFGVKSPALSEIQVQINHMESVL